MLFHIKREKMVKTAAEYQKAYRERKKARDETFLEKERARAKGYRKPIQSKTKKDQTLIRERNKHYSQKYRDRQRASKQNQVRTTITNEAEDQSNVVSSTSGEPDATSPRAKRGQPTILVKLSFPKKQCNKRKSDALKRAHSKIQRLNGKLSSLTKNKNKWAKRCQRMSKNIKNPTDADGTMQAENVQSLTPKSKTNLELRRDGVSPRKLPKAIVRKLVLSNALLEEIKVSRRANPQQNRRSIATRVISGKILQKYKCLSMVSKKTGISMIELRREQEKVIEFKRRSRMKAERDHLKAQVVEFIERDDVSVMMPGKADAKVYEGEKRQIRILTDYMANIHQRFQADTQTKISLALFCKLRPEYIKLTSSMSRNTCLCSRHQNFAMKLKCLRSLGVEISKNPETVCKNTTQEQMEVLLGNITHMEVEYETWRRVEVDGKRKMKIVSVKCSKDEFISMMKEEYETFLNHVSRVTAQYSALKSLKENLPNNELIVQMDFAENFTCGTSDEIQSAYWNASSVTLHPVVVYFKGMDNSLEHLNFVFVSDVLHHNSTAVITIMKMLCKELREIFPDAQQIHYWTDSPTSQYRNRFVFDAISHHAKRFSGFSARWNYFESGHGKGPCDGIGGVAKRKASDAIKQGKACIQDALDFFNWAKGSSVNIKYRFYTTDDFDTTTAEIQKTTPLPMKGTMKTHAVFPKDDGLFSREVSCYCQSCIIGDTVCDDWIWHGMTRKVDELPDDVNHETEASTEQAAIPTTLPAERDMVPEKDGFVAAVYEGVWYVGKILEVDISEGDAHISFMKKARGSTSLAKFKWPQPPDEIWIQFNQILCKINEPEPIGKSRREFKLGEDDHKLICQTFQRK